MEKVIDNFDGDYFFLSNYYECPVYFMGHDYKSSEAAYQAQKCPERAKEFVDLGPDEAKKLGKTVEIRSDWDSVKNTIMLVILRQKFFQNDELFEKLVATGDAELIEGNWWKDTYWGVYEGTGKNMLGKLLMQVRRECSDLHIPKD